MANSAYIGMSAALAANQRLEVVSNNLANVNTAGFRQERVRFESYLVDTNDGSPAQKGFTAIAQSSLDLQHGELEHTGNPLDLAIQGDGFFVVRGPAGMQATRAGQFQVALDGTLADPNGLPVMAGTPDDGFTPIRINAGGGAVEIASDGTVEQDGTTLARIAVVTVDEQQGITPAGGGRLNIPPNAMQVVNNPSLASGYVESSNVNIVRGMVDLIEVNRDFQTAQKLMKEGRSLDRAILQNAR